MSTKGKFTHDLIQRIGLEATQKLIATFGSQYLYFPEAMAADHPIALLLGREKAERLSYYYGGLQLLIPKGYEFELQQRNEAIRASDAAGLSYSQIAKQFNLSHRRVRAILHSQPPTVAVLPSDLNPAHPRQLSLF